MLKRLALLFALTAVVACGDDDDDGGAVDAGPMIDATPSADAPPDRGNVADGEECAVDNDCMNPASDCRQGFGATKICLNRCEATADCGYGDICYPEDLAAPAQFLGGHCFPSLCGPLQLSYWTAPSNGTLNGPCKLGREVGIPEADQLDGFCIPQQDGLYGVCSEAGTVAPGGACDFDNATRGGANCNNTALCIRAGNTGQGTCRAGCDPRPQFAGGADGCPVEGEACQDITQVPVFDDGSSGIASIGFCITGQACQTLGPNTCPAGEGCSGTNLARPTGLCNADAQGTAALGGACLFTTTDEAQQCAHGASCVGSDATAGTCAQNCDFPTPQPGRLLGACATDTDCKAVNQVGAGAHTCQNNVCNFTCSANNPCDFPFVCTGAGAAARCAVPAQTVTCGEGTSCTALYGGPGFDMADGTIDDDYTVAYGSCLAPPAP